MTITPKIIVKKHGMTLYSPVCFTAYKLLHEANLRFFGDSFLIILRDLGVEIQIQEEV